MKDMLYINKIIKLVRSDVIKEHLDAIGEHRCVCFTCGNASRYLRDTGLHVISIGDNEELKSNRWFTYTEIQKDFRLFDATSGHLPLPIMTTIAERIYDLLEPLLKNIDNDTIIYIPTGSGESLIIMCMAFPKHIFRSVRLKTRETTYNADAPLNTLIDYINYCRNP